MSRLPNPVIVIPGITASHLADEYPLPPETVWAVLPGSKLYERVSLHPDDVRYEAREPARVRPGQVYEIAYRELVEELRAGLSDDPDEPVPVYTFGYDWRKPLATLVDELAAFVREVVDRTSLMRCYHKSGYGAEPGVNLVGHSMGGLLITGYAAEYGGEGLIDKVVTLATPYRGSFESIVKITMGVGTLGTNEPSHRERKAARVTPALYHLLPTFKNGVEIAAGFPKSLFKPQAWQPSVVETVAEYVYTHSKTRLTRSEAKAAAAKLFSALLKDAAQYLAAVEAFELADAGLSEDRWLAVVGVDTETRVRLEVAAEPRSRKPAFVFDATRDVRNEWGDGDPARCRLTGDGTVPYEGAVVPFLSEENLVLVTPDDFEFWELKDKALTEFGGFHGIIPNMNMLQRLLVRYLRGARDRYHNTWGRRAPGVETWRPAELFGLAERT